jgi:dihydroorotate dehydrogenase
MAEMAPFPDIGPGSEGLKHAAEEAVHMLGLSGRVGEAAFTLAGIRVEDPRLCTEVAGLEFENPVMVGAGWDKTGRTVDGLHTLGFAGTEVGTVLVFPQAGNPKPRLWTNPTHEVSLNRLGFNSGGMYEVEANLQRQRRPGIVGISLGKNKITPAAHAAWEHAAVADTLAPYADYFVINVASPNTPGLRALLDPAPLKGIINAVQEVAWAHRKPLFVKTTVDLALDDLDRILAVCIDEDVEGIIDSNTTVDETIKARYGWAGQPGGVGGSDSNFRKLATERMRHITRETAGTGLHRIGVGGISDAASAIERIEAGAEIIQVVTAIRQRRGMVARMINKGILRELNRRGMDSVSDLVGQTAGTLAIDKHS